MKVNRGSLHFDLQGNLDDMMRQLLQAQKINTSAGTVNVKLNNLMLRSGTLRRNTTPSGPSEVSGDRDLVNTELSEMRSKFVMQQVLADISAYQTSMTKKILLVYLINEGVLFNFPDHLLRTDREMFTNNYSEELKDDIIRDNEFLNKVIGLIEEAEGRDTKVFWEKYDAKVKELMIDPEQFQALYEKMGRTAGSSKNVSNVKRQIKPYINPDKWEEYEAALKELRSGLKQYKAPSIENLCQYFELSKSSYDKGKFKAINLLQKTQGIDILRRVETGEE